MSTRQGYIKDYEGNKIAPETSSVMVLDVAREQALTASLMTLVEKNALGYPTFVTTEAHAIGDKVFYDRRLWKFTSALEQGAAWDPEKVTEFSLKEIVDAISTVVGDSALETTAQTVTGAVNELKGHDDLQDTQLTALANTKADKNGVYPQMIVGSAEDLVGGNDTSRVLTLDTAGGTADIATGIARVERIKGNSLVWNQLFNSAKSTLFITTVGTKSTVQNGVRVDTSEAGTLTIRTNPGLASINHYYYISYNIDSDGTHTYTSFNGVFVANLPKTNGRHSIIVKAKTGNSPLVLYTFSNATYAIIKDYMLIDLTKTFGAGNAPITVEEFEKLFPLDYYDYNAGGIINLLPSGIKTVGFNAYNHSTGKAVLLGGNQYQISGTYTSISYTDINGNEETITPDTNGIFTPTNNGTLTVVGGNSTNTCVHLVWSGIRNGEYEPYQESTRTLPNVQHINTDGTITESAEGKTRLFPGGLCSAGSGNNYKCDEITAERAIKYIGTRDYAEGDESDTTLTTDGVKTNYPLATPTEVVFDEPLNLSYQVNDFGTEQMLPENTSEPTTAPLSMDVVYGLNVVDFVRNAPKNYISKESMTNFLTELGTAMGGTWSMTWNAMTEKYDFDFTATPEPESEPEA